METPYNELLLSYSKRPWALHLGFLFLRRRRLLLTDH